MRRKGYIYEKKAKQWLEQRSYRILEENYYSPYGEIDLIAEKEDIIYFIEVKSSQSSAIPLTYKLSKAKKTNIMNTSLHYIEKNNITRQISFSLITIQKETTRYYKHIIDMET